MTSLDLPDIAWGFSTAQEVDGLLTERHYLGPIKSGAFVCVIAGMVGGRIAAAQVWRRPTSRRLPGDGSWLELSRWCLTADAGANAGTRQHSATVRMLRTAFPGATTLVSYSDPAQGHTGALYKACNWWWSPTWHRLRPPPTGAGDWGTGRVQHVKDRWVFGLRKDPARDAYLLVNDRGAIRRWMAGATPAEVALARRSPAADLREAAQS